MENFSDNNDMEAFERQFQSRFERIIDNLHWYMMAATAALVVVGLLAYEPPTEEQMHDPRVVACSDNMMRKYDIARDAWPDKFVLDRRDAVEASVKFQCVKKVYDK